MRFTRITVNPKQMGGVPCIRGLRVPAATVVEMVADGMTETEILNSLLKNAPSGFAFVPSLSKRERKPLFLRDMCSPFNRALATALGANGIFQQTVKAYPDLESADIPEALHYAAEAVRKREIPRVASR